MDFRITILTSIISSCSPTVWPSVDPSIPGWDSGWIPPKERIEEDLFSDIAVARPKIMGDFFNPIRKKQTYNNKTLEYPINMV